MIEFIQDYVTKSLPPETFKDGEQVTRSAESELYLVRLGVAGYVVDGVLVDQDYQPIVRQTVAVVVSTDRRFADTGRGGEVIGLAAPQRASSGPGNEVVFSGQPDSTTLDGVDVAQLTADLASARQASDDATGREQGLVDELATARDEHGRITNELGEARGEIGRLNDEVSTARTALGEANGKVSDLITRAETAEGRVAELEGIVADLRAAQAAGASEEQGGADNGDASARKSARGK